MTLQSPLEPDTGRRHARDSFNIFVPRHDFNAVIDFEGGLSAPHKKEVKELYAEVRQYLAERKMNMALASLDLLIELRQVAPRKKRIRDDGTSAYMHELSQAMYLIWLLENRKSVISWVNKRQGLSRIFSAFTDTNGGKSDDSFLFQTRVPDREALEMALTLCFNHDSGEDLYLTETEFKERMAPHARHFKSKRAITTLGECFELITKRKDQGETMEAYAYRVGLQPLALGDKMVDRMHNLMSLIGSGRSLEKMADYLGETVMLLGMNSERIKGNGTLSYLEMYLEAQIDLISLYLDVKQPRGNNSIILQEQAFEALVKKIEMYTDRYQTATISYKIHPMLGVIRRIVDDPEISNLLLPRTDLERVPLVLPGSDPVLPAPAPGK